MARKVERDPLIVRRVVTAIDAVEGGKPTHPELRRRAAKGTLKLNPTSVAMEAGINRHLIEGPDDVYGEEWKLLSERMSPKGRTKPLAAQLKEARRRLKVCQGRLAKSRSYAFQLLVRMHQLEKEKAQLAEELENARSDEPDEPLIGSGKVVALPPKPTRQGRQPLGSRN